jgi:DNA-binding transcriptional MerR regulator
MQEPFFTSKEAARISGCTLRQLQYWREKGIVVPTIASTGTGRSIYYRPGEVMELVVLGYCLQLGLNLDIATATLKLLKDKSPNLLQTVTQRWLCSWDGKMGRLEIVDFSEAKAIEWLKAQRLVFPLWLEDSSLTKLK